MNLKQETEILLSVLVLSWNTRDLLRQCLQSTLDSLGDISSEIIVVDNASSDGSTQMVQEEFGSERRVHLIVNDYNTGFAEGNNQAFSVAQGQIIALVNSDIVMNKRALHTMFDYIQTHDHVGIVSCNLVGIDGKPQSIHRALPTLPIIFFVFTRIGRYLDKSLLNRYYGRVYKLFDLSRKGVATVGQVAAACCLLRKSTIEQVGGLFNEDFPILGNDVELSKRIWDASLEAHVLFDISVEHLGSASLEQVESYRRKVWLWQAFKRFYGLHEPSWKQLLLFLVAPWDVKLAMNRAGW